MAKRFLFFIFLFMSLSVWAQMTPEEYISKYKDLAISEMHREGVPAAITLAQGMLETQFGNSDLFKESNNHFGIKCRSDWTGPSVKHDDDKPGECFRVYSSDEESYRDHSDFLKNGKRYAFLFNLSPTDYKGWAKGLYKAGYATNPSYSNTLIKYIEKYNLNDYTDIGLVSVGNDSEVTVLNNQNTVENIANTGNLTKPNVATNNESTVIPPKQSPDVKTYKVEPQEGLYAIARKFGVTVPQLKEWNQLQSDNLQVGQKLIIFQ